MFTPLSQQLEANIVSSSEACQLMGLVYLSHDLADHRTSQSSESQILCWDSGSISLFFELPLWIPQVILSIGWVVNISLLSHLAVLFGWLLRLVSP